MMRVRLWSLRLVDAGSATDQVFFALDADRFKQFTAMLDAPPSSNPGLERLLAVKAPWDTGSI